MTKKFIPLVALIACLALFPGALTAAEQANPAEAKLRDALRNSMLQLRDAQNQLATLQAAQVESDKEKETLNAKVKELNGKLDGLTKQNDALKELTDKTIASLNAKVTDQSSQITRFAEALEKWKASYNQLVLIARTKEAERARLTGEAIVLQRRIDDRETKNCELFKLANEILTRYEKFSLGDALAAKEPFIGTTRVKLENLVQEYQDKLAAQKTSPDDAMPTGVAPAGTATANNTP